MGFDCKICGEREMWDFESDIPKVCKDCREKEIRSNKESLHIEALRVGYYWFIFGTTCANFWYCIFCNCCSYNDADD